jgi:hypothetical protein
MARRRPNLVACILLLALLLLGPLMVVLAVGLLVPSVPASLEKTLLLVAMIWLFCAMLLAPAVLFRDSGSSSDPGDGDGGGGGGGPPRSPSPPIRPRGGIPLPDAAQARARVRDHTRPKLRRLGPRRSTRQPERAPGRTVPHR